MIGGIVPATPGVGQVWAFGTDQWRSGIVELTRFVRKLFTDALEHDYHRLQALVWSEHTDSIRWLSALGFEIEGTMKQSGKNGEDFLSMGRVR